MSNYTKSTNFATKDALASGNPLKIVKGTEIDTEFNNIATAVATKADLSGPSFTGTVTIATLALTNDLAIADGGTGASTAAGAAANLASEFGKLLYPVGSIYINSTNSTNPGTLLGFGTWVAFGAGRVPVGFDSGNALFDTAEETGGSADAVVVSHTHTASVTDPGHTHNYLRQPNTPYSGDDGAADGPSNFSINYQVSTATSSSTTGITVSNSTTGSSGTNANYQPYITVYMWKRTA
jgi:hypothetical protein